MSAIASLSKGVIPLIMAGEDIDSPVLQILSVRKIRDTNYLCLLISDSQYFNSFAMLASQLNSKFGDGKLKDFSIVRLDRYIITDINNSNIGKSILTIMDMTVLNPGDQVQHKIGEPISYTEASQETPKPSVALVQANNETNTNHKNNKRHNFSEFWLCPIQSLAPRKSKWFIKARISDKTAIKNCRNNEHKYFNVYLRDNSGEIRAIGFDEKVDKFYDLLEVNKVYYISNCLIKTAHKTFGTSKNNWEIHFTNDTVIEVCEDDDKSVVPEIKYNFIPISQVENLEPNTVVDCVGVCKEVSELKIFRSRANKECKKRELVLFDTSEATINLTLWDDNAVKFDGNVHSIILVKAAKVFKLDDVKYLNFVSGSVIKINPDIPECHTIREWLENGGGKNITNWNSARVGGSSTKWLTFHEAHNLETGDEDCYFNTKAVIRIIKSNNIYYKSCPQPNCNKQLVDEYNGQFRCEKCNAVYSDFKYKLRLSLCIGDWTFSKWVTCFSDVAEELLGRSAQEIGNAMNNNPTAAEEILDCINFRSYIFHLRSKFEIYEHKNRYQLIVQSATPVNHKEYNKYLINNLKELTGINK